MSTCLPGGFQSLVSSSGMQYSAPIKEEQQCIVDISRDLQKVKDAIQFDKCLIEHFKEASKKEKRNIRTSFASKPMTLNEKTKKYFIARCRIIEEERKIEQRNCELKEINLQLQRSVKKLIVLSKSSNSLFVFEDPSQTYTLKPNLRP